jgi:hypothetical protein
MTKKYSVLKKLCNAHNSEMKRTYLSYSMPPWILIFMPSQMNLLKPTGYIQQLYILPTLYLCVLYLSENKQWLVPFTDKLIGFCNRDEKCLQRGTNWVFK